MLAALGWPDELREGEGSAATEQVSNSPRCAQVYDFPQWQKHRGQYRFINRLFQVTQ